jgi:flagellar hook protein FlgE
MLRSMFSAVSGLRAHQTMMDVIGNNIANVNTAGYKSGQVVFEDLLSQILSGANAPAANLGGTNPNQVGLGVRLGSIVTSFVQGASQETGRNTDMSIQGDGFFLTRNEGQNLFTRLGSFSFDADGRLVTPDGGIVQGWVAQGGGVNLNAPTADMRIPLGQILPPSQTNTVKLGGNIPADAAPGTVLTTAPTVYDAQGTAIPITFTFTKSAALSFADGVTTTGSTTLTSATANFTAADVGKAISGAGIPAGTTIQSVTNGTTIVLSQAATATAAGVAVSANPLPNSWSVGATAPDVNGTTQSLTEFNPPFVMTFNALTGLPNAPLPTIDSAALGTLLGRSFNPGTISMDLGKAGDPDALQQFAGSNSFATLSQDGSAVGFLRSFSIANDGLITGVFSNGKTEALGQIALATFNNPAGLQKVGNSSYQSTFNSGLPQIGVAGSGGRGTLSGGTLEMSNVDLAQEFTNLIVAQRGFEANSKVITASDELLQDLVNLKR